MITKRQPVQKIICTTEKNQTVILLLPKPISYPTYYAYRYCLIKSGKYKTVKRLDN